jgi:hypothetical protein
MLGVARRQRQEERLSLKSLLRLLRMLFGFHCST